MHCVLIHNYYWFMTFRLLPLLLLLLVFASLYIAWAGVRHGKAPEEKIGVKCFINKRTSQIKLSTWMVEIIGKYKRKLQFFYWNFLPKLFFILLLFYFFILLFVVVINLLSLSRSISIAVQDSYHWVDSSCSYQFSSQKCTTNCGRNHRRRSRCSPSTTVKVLYCTWLVLSWWSCQAFWTSVSLINSNRLRNKVRLVVTMRFRLESIKFNRIKSQIEGKEIEI